MRGKLAPRRLESAIRRNIPAYAGKTLLGCQSPRAHQEHPRVCGENEIMGLRKFFAKGTSPRMRGKLIFGTVISIHSRNIPAYAGKTFEMVSAHLGAREHPRVCGENPCPCPHMVVKSGTSPRMRGKRSSAHAWSGCGGNIPAYAGKTRVFLSLILSKTEHPRVCGENPLLRLS